MTESISEALAHGAHQAKLSSAIADVTQKLLIDGAGLCVAARHADYVQAALKGWESGGRCTAIGHARTLDAAGAAFVNGTAAHGEDFDDTFEGGPVHAGAVIVPAGVGGAGREKLAGGGARAGGAGGGGGVWRPGPGGAA